MSASWAEQLKVLLDLQKIDGQIFFLERELSAKPAEKKHIEAQFESKKDALKKAEQSLKELQMKQKERENELLTKESSIEKYKTQQMQVKTNKEYSALTQEINTLKANCSIFEDEILRLMDSIEAQKKSVEGERKILAEEEKKLKSQLGVIDARAAAVEKELNELKASRSQYLPSVGKALLQQYERILKKKEGIAIAALNNETCSVCNVTMTPQTVNEILMNEKMITCDSCGRIVYKA